MNNEFNQKTVSIIELIVRIAQALPPFASECFVFSDYWWQGIFFIDVQTLITASCSRQTLLVTLTFRFWNPPLPQMAIKNDAILFSTFGRQGHRAEEKSRDICQWEWYPWAGKEYCRDVRLFEKCTGHYQELLLLGSVIYDDRAGEWEALWLQAPAALSHRWLRPWGGKDFAFVIFRGPDWPSALSRRSANGSGPLSRHVCYEI